MWLDAVVVYTIVAVVVADVMLRDDVGWVEIDEKEQQNLGRDENEKKKWRWKGKIQPTSDEDKEMVMSYTFS